MAQQSSSSSSSSKEQPSGFKYIGGGAWLPGVPARDLAAEEVESEGYDRDELTGSGLYKPGQVKAPVVEVKVEGPASENDAPPAN